MRRRGTPPADPPPLPAEERFRRLDKYRVDREWRRYEGTPLRDLFRELRLRFLGRHGCPVPGPVLEVGPGPGRFSGALGAPDHSRILLDLSREALVAARSRLEAAGETERVPTDLLRGNGRNPPFRSGSFGQVVLLGNTLGFAGPGAEALLRAVDRCLAPGGSVLLEIVAGPGERSNYLHRLPPGALRRLLAAPTRALVPRVLREGFRPLESARRSAFRRFSVAEQDALLGSFGWRLEERLAVAPALGHDPDQLRAIWEDPRAREKLLLVEEAVGGEPGRWPRASALLVAARADRAI